VRKRRTHSEKFKAKAVSRVQAGESVNSVAKSLDVAGSVIAGWLANAPKPRKAGATGTGRYTEDFKVAAIQRIRAGETIAEVAADLECSVSQLSRWLASTQVIGSAETPAARGELDVARALLKSALDYRSSDPEHAFMLVELSYQQLVRHMARG
jgi:transposase-like protein